MELPSSGTEDRIQWQLICAEKENPMRTAARPLSIDFYPWSAVTSSARFVQFCVQYASVALIYYDFTLTFDRELRYIWKRPLSISMLLVAFCRYSLIANVVFALGLVNKLNGLRSMGEAERSPPNSCDNAYIVAASLSLLGRIGILSILGARTCAIFHYNRIMVAFFSILGLAVMVLAVLHVPYVSCNGKKLNKENRNVAGWINALLIKSFQAVDALSVLIVVYELLSTALLAYGCFRSLRIAGNFKWDKKGLFFLILQEGLLYTGFVTVFTTATMVLTYAAPLGSFASRSLNALTLPISGMMMARFLIHVREWKRPDGFTATHLHVAPSEMEFQHSVDGPLPK
ncbi:hypothetical protein DFP72DRAFT_1125150 [Ephemerocybe angulata]|uniref:DUF6533 domain-containing protein n=1 Tax=Ephemerocybe angulata TaxID=980116 RepID=A0A8H6M7V3_9AGAR|nr:hypothetical protein DFP72DRAFT_1125150 [Tulosesus angulatus]